VELSAPLPSRNRMPKAKLSVITRG